MTAWAGDAAALQRSHIIHAKYPVAGASGWLPHGYALCDRVLDAFRALFEDGGYEELGLPSAVPLSALERQAGSIKSFLDRVYLLRDAEGQGAPGGGDEPLVLASTIEAQISLVMADWLREGRTPPFRVSTVRTVGRHEGHGMRPLWMERFVWPFFEAQAAFTGDSSADVAFLLHGPGRVAAALGLPTFAVERLKEPGAKGAYADRRHELVTLLPEGASTTLTSVYELGTRFSETFGVRHGAEPLTMLNFGFSARLVLALLVHSHDDPDRPVYHPSVAPVQVAVVPAVLESAERAARLAQALRERGVRAEAYDDHRGLKARAGRARAHGVPLFLTAEGPARGEVLLLGADAGEGEPVGERDLAERVSERLAALGADLVRDRAAAHRARVLDLDAFPGPDGPAAVPAAARVPLCHRDACAGAALDRPGLDVIGRLTGENGVPFGDDAAAAPPRACACCGRSTGSAVLLGRKFRGEK
ncbi:His/Gly/Thr/Pro-type tRNA ligase C-terminal domain-containing protein [Streptomyces sp. NPDC093546]|uniref:His/Gly/Thr/Pro-type tRNA ligase C-terminal domain-containing protein n=1 Tax=Streptomyces sp. NPDC093546 TaxID=3366040 RepID=UPI0037FCDBC1